MKKLFRITRINLAQWRIDPKYLFVLLYTGLYLWYCLRGMRDYAKDLNTTIHPWVFPFLMRGGSVICPLMLGFAILIADAPFRNGQQQFILLRTGKIYWMAGQILYLFLLSVFFTAFMYLMSVLCAIPQLRLSTEWGSFLTTIAVSGFPGKYGNLSTTYSIMKGASPISATLWAFTVFTLVCFFLSMVMLLCNLWVGKGVGIVLVSTAIILPKIMTVFQAKPYIYRYLTRISPLSWPDRSAMGHTGQYLPSYAYGILMPLFLSVLLAAVAMATVQKCNLDMNKE